MLSSDWYIGSYWIEGAATVADVSIHLTDVWPNQYAKIPLLYDLNEYVNVRGFINNCFAAFLVQTTHSNICACFCV